MIEERQLYYKITKDWSTLPEVLQYFENEAEIAKKSDLVMIGRVENLSSKLPVLMDKRFTQLQILNAILEYFEKELDIIKAKHYKNYLEKYQRSLTSRDVEKYVAGEKEVVDIALIMNEISLMRNVFIGITKSIDAKSYQINNISRLRAAGLEDATID